MISNVVNETRDYVNYTLVTSFNERDLEEAQIIYGSKVRILALKSNNFASACLSFLLKAPARGFDIVHFHDLPFGRSLPYFLKLFLRGINLVLSYHYNPETTKIFPLNYKAGMKYYRFCFKRFSKAWRRIIVNSKYVQNDLSRYRDAFSKTTVIPNGVNVEVIQKSRPAPLDGNPSFLYVGHLEWHKGVDILLHAFKDLSERQGFKNAHLHLVGSGRMERWCKEFVHKRKLNKKVHFWGIQPQNVVFSFLKGCDVFILPSRHEAFPIVLLEAMAAEKPIISTNVGGVPEILKHGRNALLINPDHTNLANAMQQLKEDMELMKILAENNKRDVAKFSWRDISRRYLDLYGSITFSGSS